MFRLIRYARYDDKIDLTGKDLVSLAWYSRSQAEKALPFLVDRSSMKLRIARTKSLLNMTGEVADEVHEFRNARQGKSGRLQRIHFRRGEVSLVVLK